MSLQPGQILDNKYRIVRLIGEGGMGAVFEGENTLIKRRVAIKVLHAQAASHEGTVLRFEREAQAAGRIGSEHILEILDLGVLPGGERYMVMEFLDGEPLSSRIRKHGRLTPAQLYPLFRQALTGLEAAHRAGIVHRDLKPDNIFVLHRKLGHQDFVKLIDFGISKFNVVGGDMAMTRTGAVMGTPYYMSPEQAKGASNIDARSDLYTMGVIAYEALAGQVPFNGDTFNELMFKIVLSTPVPLGQAVPETDPQWIAIVEKMMAREVGDRYQSAEEIIGVLDTWAAGGNVAAAAPQATRAPQPSTHEVYRPAPTTGTNPGVAAGTTSSWASSQADGAPPKPRRTGAIIGAVAAAVLIAGGALAFKLAGGDSKATAEGAASASGNAAATTALPPAAPSPVEEKAKPVPEPTPPATAPASSAAAPAPAASSAAPAPAVAPVAPTPVIRRGVSAPRPKSEPAPSHPTSTSKSKDREFGY